MRALVPAVVIALSGCATQDTALAHREAIRAGRASSEELMAAPSPQELASYRSEEVLKDVPWGATPQEVIAMKGQPRERSGNSMTFTDDVVGTAVPVVYAFYEGHLAQTKTTFSGSPPAKLIEKGMEMRYGKPAYVFDKSAALKQTLARAQEEDTRERIFASLFHMSGGFYGFGRESDRAAVRLAASAMPERDVAWKTKESAVRLTMPGGSNAQVVASSLKLGPLLAKQYEEDVKAALQK